MAPRHTCLWAAAAVATAAARLVGVSFVDFGKGGDNDIAVANLTLTAGVYNLSFAPEVRMSMRAAWRGESCGPLCTWECNGTRLRARRLPVSLSFPPRCQVPTNDHYGYSCVMAYRASPPAFAVISGEQPSVQILTLDATTGALTSAAKLAPQYIVVDMSFNSADGLLYALASPDGSALHIVTIDAATGAVAVVDAAVPALIPRFCESGLSLSGADPRLYFTADTNTTDPDDGDQAIHVYDLPSRSIVSSAPWFIKNGSLNALAAATLPGAAGETLLAIATDPVERGTRPLQLLSITASTGAAVVLGTAPLPPGSPGPLIPSLGALAVDAPGRAAITVLYDDAESAYYIATWSNLTAAGGLAPLSFVPVAPTAGAVWKVQWA